MNLEEIKKAMPAEETVEDVSELFKVLGDPTRSKILFVLEQGPLCVGDISECIGMTKFAVSHQLKTLKTAHLVKAKREGKEVIYSLDDEHVSTLFQCALEHVLE